MVFEYKHFEVNHILESLAKGINATVVNKAVQYPPSLGKGYLKGVELPSGIKYFTFEYEYFENLLIHHIPDENESYFIWFDVSKIIDPLVFKIDKELKESASNANMNGFLLSSKMDFSLDRPSLNKGYGVAIILHKKILDKILQQSIWGNALEWYYDFKVNKLNNIKITDAENELIQDVIQGTAKENNLINLEKRIYQLLELFFIRTFNLYNNIVQKKKLSTSEGDALLYFEKLIASINSSNEMDYNKMEKDIHFSKKEIEALILRVFNKTLINYIKETKLKNAYKEIVNTTKNISDIAYEFGYANPSNFSAAFKLQFGKNPHEFR
jgi:AraC-like DNA-binding protein